MGLEIDPSMINTEELGRQGEALNNYLDQAEENEAAEELLQNKAIADKEQALAEQKDPRDAEKWGFKALAKEGQSILSGGLQDTASSITTFPERTADALTGEIARERKEKGFIDQNWIHL